MIEFICLFFPAVLGLWAYEKLSKRQLTAMDWVYRYCATVLIVNVLCFAVKRFIFFTAYLPFAEQGDLLPGAALNYLALALPATAITVLFELLLSKKVKVVLEETKDEEGC